MSEKQEKKMEELTFEEAMARLEEIVQLLEKGDATLDGMLALYEEGSALMRFCNALLENAKRKVEKVSGEDIVAFEGENA